MTLKHISEFPKTGISFPFTITHAGKLSLLESSYERFKHSNNFQDTIDNVYIFFTHAFHLKEWIQHFSGKKTFKRIGKQTMRTINNIYFVKTFVINQNTLNFLDLLRGI